MNVSIFGLPGDQFSAEDEEFMPISSLPLANCRNRVRRPLQHLMLGDLLPFCSQRARVGTRLGGHDQMEFACRPKGRGCGKTWENDSKCCEQEVRNEASKRAGRSYICTYRVGTVLCLSTLCVSTINVSFDTARTI